MQENCSNDSRVGVASLRGQNTAALVEMGLPEEVPLGG
jgi:hypothetical protein